MERLLTLWFESEVQKNQPVDLARFHRKALAIYGDLTKDTPNPEPFTASRGWFDRYKKRSNLRGVVKRSGEAASADGEAASAFVEMLREIVEEGGYLPQQIFNCNETGLFWKRMPSRTYISKEEKSIPGFKMVKGRMTILLGGNASGDMKLKPMLVYHSQNPRALKGMVKHRLPVVWKANKKAWVTQSIFSEWFNDHFLPAVKQYCKRMNLSHKILLLLDNCPGHPPSIGNDCENVKVVFLPPNTTSLLQPIDQAVIKTFKSHYLRRNFAQSPWIRPS
ncbi:tigger transposable element-derived protein 1-like [Ischnura elegans]|uniref:tigger transposable element-derived protein 1-like n=1 Tax=Ischnura elegans TaxID=197161 RepID=UPI001ED8B96F|nr:tigger transposable element-derived protein 1-like [Ischnura elegans]